MVPQFQDGAEGPPVHAVLSARRSPGAQLPLRGIARAEGGEVVRQVSECRVVLLVAVVVATGCHSPIYGFFCRGNYNYHQLEKAAVKAEFEGLLV